MNKKTILLILGAALLVGIGIGVYLYTKKADTVTSKADMSIQLNQWVDEVLAAPNGDKKYIGKGLQFKGVVSEILKDSGKTNVKMIGGKEGIEIVCEFDKNQSEELVALTEGDELELIGSCSGISGGDDPESILGKSIKFARCKKIQLIPKKTNLGTQVEKDTSNNN